MKFGLENFRTWTEAVRHLAVGLRSLSFSDNFQSFEIVTTIPAGVEVRFRNPLTSIPKGYIIYKQTGNGLVTAGDTAWTESTVYLKNHGTVEVTVTVKFFK